MVESAGPSSSDDDAVADLHREHAAQMRRLAWAMLRDWSLADDAVQDAFLLLAMRCHDVPVEQRVGWLVRTVQFSALNLRRTRLRQQRLEKARGADQSDQRLINPPSYSVSQSVREETDGYAVDPGPPPGRDIERVEELERMHAALLLLSAEQQWVVRQRLLEDKSFREIAEGLAVPLGTVLSRMRLAMEKLRNKLT